MTPNKQVSPAIRILRGERDASARATHLEAATRKFLVTTNERKYMSIKTNFKRIALVAAVALGSSVFSAIPVNAAFTINPTMTSVDGTATYETADSSTAGTVSAVWSSNNSDTITFTVSQVAGPVAISGRMTFVDTSGAFVATGAGYNNMTSSADVGITTHRLTGSDTMSAISASGYNAFKIAVQLDTATARHGGSKDGTYTYRITAALNPIGGVASGESSRTFLTKDVNIVIATPTAGSKVASVATSTAYMSTTAANSSATTDAAPNALATASTTAKAYIYVNLKNAAGSAAAESLTVTTNIGSVGTSSAAVGKSIVLAYSGAMDVGVYSDGTAGTATITIKSTSVTFASKTVNFYAAAAKTMTATIAHPILKVGDNAGAVRGTGVDANGVAWAGTAYIVASSAADALIAGSTTPVSCGTYDTTNLRHNCPVTAIAAGTAKFKIIDASTVALATATSNEVTVTVSIASVAKVALSFDKAIYAPNERMRIYVTAQDASGAALPAGTYTTLLAAGGITANSGFSGSSDTTTAVSITTSASSSSTTGAKAGSAMYTVYAPAAGGTVTISATGGTSLPVAGQVAVTATATVTDSGAAALAAVTALATTVASLKTLITTLTNLVLKIQKKVKA